MSAVWELQITRQDTKSMQIIADGIRLALQSVKNSKFGDIKNKLRRLTKEHKALPHLALPWLSKQLVIFGLVMALARHTFGDFIERYRTALTAKLESTGMPAHQASLAAKTEANKRSGLDLSPHQLINKYQAEAVKVGKQQQRLKHKTGGTSIPHLGSYIRDALNHSPSLRALGAPKYDRVLIQDEDNFEAIFRVDQFQQFSDDSCQQLDNSVQDGPATGALNMPSGMTEARVQQSSCLPAVHQLTYVLIVQEWWTA